MSLDGFLGPEHTQLEPVDVLDTPLATHLRYRITGRGQPTPRS